MNKIRENVLLSDFSNYKIGGRARYFTELETVEDLRLILESARNYGPRDIFILGGGTNILFDDAGFDGLVVHNKIKGLKEEGNSLVCGSGETIESILNYCIEHSLSGLEWAGGLPGTIGGAVRGNAGAFGGETKDSVLEVESIDLKTLEIKKRSMQECGFSYRQSVFKNAEGRPAGRASPSAGKGELIISVTLSLRPGQKDEIAAKINEKIEYRKRKHPLEYPNIGSIFKNVPFETLPENLKEEFGQYVKNDPFPVVPTAKIIALCEIKGTKIGGAMLSDKHTNFIVNVNHATSKDVRDLISFIRQKVQEKYRIPIEEEIIYLKR